MLSYFFTKSTYHAQHLIEMQGILFIHQTLHLVSEAETGHSVGFSRRDRKCRGELVRVNLIT